MEIKRKAKGSWGVRFFIVVLGIILGVLFFWLLSFVEGDIGTMKGPEWNTTRSLYVTEELDNQQTLLSKEVENLKRKIQTQTEQQRLLSSSTTALQNTISQLLSIQKESLVKDVEFSEKSKQTLQESQAAFLENQQKYQYYNKDITELTQLQREKEDALADVNEAIKTQEQEARNEYDKLYEKHRLKVAVLKLAFLVPVFLLVSVVFMKYRTSAYWPLVWAGFIAAFIKVAFVVHEYFPTEYFKYIALLVIIAIVLRILVYLIRLIVAPRKDLLIKQYQQHYDKCICPVCSKPIRTGPLRYIGGLHKKAQVPGGQSIDMTQQEVYTCPSCGTELYDKCGQCGNIRHTLLPYCEHCGAEESEV
ncbi:MAG: hypothetical protein ISS71_06880 [Phycisphaerae bacterium]|nr:hypothetical protein [Phycisphaerae bacterium]